MHTSQNDIQELVRATGVHFIDDALLVSLSDGRTVSLPYTRIEWLSWLAEATPSQRVNWTLEPDGYAIYWEDLDDGFEVMHLLGLQPLV